MIIPCGKRKRPGSPSARWRRAFPLILRAGDTRGLLEVPRKAGCHEQTPGLFLLRPVRLTVRIAGFQSADGASIPPRAAFGQSRERRENRGTDRPPAFSPTRRASSTLRSSTRRYRRSPTGKYVCSSSASPMSAHGRWVLRAAAGSESSSNAWHEPRHPGSAARRCRSGC